MHDHGNHIHYHPAKDEANKEKILNKISSADNFKGFDDFMYFSYKNWLLFQENQADLDKAKNTFIEVGKKFKKFKDSQDPQSEAEKYLENITNVTDMMGKHDLHNATVLVENFVKPYTIADKFVRNFNKKIVEA